MPAASPRPPVPAVVPVEGVTTSFGRARPHGPCAHTRADDLSLTTVPRGLTLGRTGGLLAGLPAGLPAGDDGHRPGVTGHAGADR